MLITTLLIVGKTVKWNNNKNTTRPYKSERCHQHEYFLNVNNYFILSEMELGLFYAV